MKELKFEELTTRQKLGMTFTAFMNDDNRTPEEDEFVLDLIRNHSLGMVWIQHDFAGAKELMEKVKAVADYPILIITDAGNGIGAYKVGRHNAIGTAGTEAHAYAFGKTVGVTARKMGYNIITNPVLDMKKGSQGSMGQDKYQVTKLAKAMSRGLHDGGVITLSKHYPGAQNDSGMDSHMAETYSNATKEELLDYGLYPYLELMKENLIDGIMTTHIKLKNIDPDHPVSLSKKSIDIIREQGFDGIAITDALCMMGIRAKYDDVQAKGLAIHAGNDTILPFGPKNSELFEQLCTAYEQGYFSEQRLDEAAKRVLNAQHKTMIAPKDAELTKEELDLFSTIDKDGVYAKTDAGLLPSISRDGKHYFVIMVRNDTGIEAEGRVCVDTFSGRWFHPFELEKKLKKLFPNSKVAFINEFPTQMQNCRILEESLGCDELVFFTFTEFVAFLGPEHLTRRFVSLIGAMQHTNRVSTLVHFGNACVLEELPHIPRVIIGGNSEGSVDGCVEVLAGNYPAKGVPTYEFKLQ
ncbi:MAG: hypothetical protein IJB70_01165 [Clostridia bacterium]|nr:hypothetical protein [Clostridia bacterium]